VKKRAATAAAAGVAAAGVAAATVAVAKARRAARKNAAGARGPRGRGQTPPEPIVFFSREWAKAAKDAMNAGPSEEARAKKIERFWEWIEKAKQHVNCQLGLAVRGLPTNGRRPGRDCLLLDLERGRCVRARLVPREDAERTATYILSGSGEDWREIMGGFDMGKAVMYRKLMLEKGEVLEFFKSIYYWTESLACIQRIPTEFPVRRSARVDGSGGAAVRRQPRSSG
jgi:hypothetical protein